MRFKVVTMSILAVLLVAGSARAQTDVQSLPGDSAGGKLPFQKYAFVYVTKDLCEGEKTIDLAAGSYTLEAVTVEGRVDPQHVPTLSVATWVAGQEVKHQIALTRHGSFKWESAGLAYDVYAATHGVRLHHESKGDQPLKLHLIHWGDAPCESDGAINSFQVSISGYWLPPGVKL